MGEEEKKKAEEEKMEEKKPEEKKEEKKASQEIVLRVFMHCEGCAKKVRRCLKGFEGVEDVQTDCKAQKVVVKAEEKVDPAKVLERVQKKSHRQVELISPAPKPAPAEEDAKKPEEKVTAKPEEKKEEAITVVLSAHMHCEACAQEIKRRILRMTGVESVEPDLKSSQVTVKGIFDPSKLVEYVNKRTGKKMLIVKQEPEKKEEEKGKGKEEEKAEKKAEEAEKGGHEAAVPAEEGGGGSSSPLLGMNRSEFYPSSVQNYQIDPYLSRFDLNGYDTPQMFSDENPNACSVM